MGSPAVEALERELVKAQDVMEAVIEMAEDLLAIADLHSATKSILMVARRDYRARLSAVVVVQDCLVALVDNGYPGPPARQADAPE